MRIQSCLYDTVQDFPIHFGNENANIDLPCEDIVNVTDLPTEHKDVINDGDTLKSIIILRFFSLKG